MRKSTTTPPTKFAKALRDARENAGIGLDRASVMVQDLLGTYYGSSRETIRNYETGGISEDQADVLVVAALAQVYDVPLVDISPEVARRATRVKEWLGEAKLTDVPENCKD